MAPTTFKLVTLLGCFQLISGGYVPAPAGYPVSYYPSLYPNVVKQPYIQAQFLRPVSNIVQIQQKQPLQLRPPTTPSIALPNTRPSVVAIHAQQPQNIPVTAVSSSQNFPVVAIQAQQQNQFQTIPVSPTRPQQTIPVVAVQAQGPRKIVLPLPTEVASVPSYSYGYAVNDPTTGDQKSHEETRTGDNVVGRYSLVEPDGTLRTVTYTAGVNGFNAVVERTPGFAPPNAPAKIVPISKPVAITTPVFAPTTIISKPIAIPVKPTQSTVPVYPAGFHFGG